MRRLAALPLLLVSHLALADAPVISGEPAPGEPAPGEPAPAVRVAAAEPVSAVPAMAAMPVDAPVDAAVDAAVDAPVDAAGLDRRLDEDAAGGRAFVGDTALTTPRGRVVIEGVAPTAPVMLGTARFGVTDRLEVNASVLLIPDATPVGFGIKAQLYRTSRLAMSAGVQAITAEGDTVWRPHAEATMCADAACVATLSVMLNGFGVSGESAVPVTGGIGWAVGRKVQFIGEVHHWKDATDGLTMGVIGARAAKGAYAVDAGLAFAIDSSTYGSDGGALPFFGFAARL